MGEPHMSAPGVTMLRGFEGIMDGDPRTVNLDPYLCPAGWWTIGWGHVVHGPDGAMLHGHAQKALAYSMFPGGITMDQAVQLLQHDLIQYEDHAKACLGDSLADDTTQGEFDAMVDFTFNAGAAHFHTSSILRFHKAGARSSDYGAGDPSIDLAIAGHIHWNQVQDDAVLGFLQGRYQPDNAADAFLMWTKAKDPHTGEMVVLDGLARRRLAERRLYLTA